MPEYDVTHLVADTGIDTHGRRLLYDQRSRHFRMKVPNGVQIVGFTSDNKIVSITEAKTSGETYCHLPSGTMEDGETPEEAATREFEEETGYGFNNLIRISTVKQAPPHLYGDNIVFVATGCRYNLGIREPDPTEKIIRVEELAPAELERRLSEHLTKTPGKGVSGSNSLAALRLALFVANRDGLLNPPVTEKSPLLVVIAGLPLSGKTTLGDAIRKKLGLPFCDIDRLREHITGLPTKRENDLMWAIDPEAGKKSEQYMRIAYQSLHDGAVDAMLGAGRSLIIAATYSRKGSQEFLKSIADRHGAMVRVVLCAIKGATQKEMELRMAREVNKEYASGCSSWEDYQEISARYQSVLTTRVFPPGCILKVDTSQPLDIYLPQVISFIQS